MNKEEIEKAKEELQFFNEGDYITKEMSDSARVLEGYIKELENEIEMYKDFKEIANMKMGDRNVIRAIKNYKTLDKVTDKLKEDIEKFDKLRKTKEMYSPSEERISAKYFYAQEILEIIKLE